MRPVWCRFITISVSDSIELFVGELQQCINEFFLFSFAEYTVQCSFDHTSVFMQWMMVFVRAMFCVLLCMAYTYKYFSDFFPSSCFVCSPTDYRCKNVIIFVNSNTCIRIQCTPKYVWKKKRIKTKSLEVRDYAKNGLSEKVNLTRNVKIWP